mgnify:CR=1 FL=1
MDAEERSFGGDGYFRQEKKKGKKGREVTVFGRVVNVVENRIEAVCIHNLGICELGIQLLKDRLESKVEVLDHVVHIVAAFTVHTLLPN